MAITHTSCLPGDAAYFDFVALPSSIYRPDVKKAPGVPTQYLLRCIIVYKDGTRAARIALYHNPHIQYYSRNAFLAGGFESIDDIDVVQHLFTIIEQFAVEQRCNYIIGPMNGSTWEDYRLPLSQEHRLFFTETPYPEYYVRLWTQCGFDVLSRYYSSASAINPTEDLLNQSQKIRSINVEEFETELSRIYDLCMKAFAQNNFFSPITEESFISKYIQVRPLIDSDMALIAEGDRPGDLQAVLFCLPDIFDSTNSTLIIKTIAKHPSAAKGLMTEMLSILYQRAYKKGYRKMIHAFMHETNRSNKLSQRFGGEIFREYTLFVKPVHEYRTGK